MSADSSTESHPSPPSASDGHAERKETGSLRQWFLESDNSPEQLEEASQHTDSWWRVMCLTGVDYFSTLGYQPGIAFLMAGIISPIATFILVLVTLFVALPIYRQVAARSPHGHGSIIMLEELLPRWRGKVFILFLLGFALTDFVITITLSAADATAHILMNPFVPGAFRHPVAVTLVLLGLLGAVFLKGFKEALWIAVLFVGTYLLLNAILLAVGFYQVWTHPEAWVNWKNALLAEHSNPWMILGIALILFPKLALGLSGFETGVAVMTHVKGAPGDTTRNPVGRIRNTQKLLLAAALIMSFALMASSIVTTLLIPASSLCGGRRGQRTCSRLSRAQVSRPWLRDPVRHGHHLHPLVRGSVGHGWVAESGSTATCLRMAWRPTGHGPADRSCWYSLQSRLR